MNIQVEEPFEALYVLTQEEAVEEFKLDSADLSKIQEGGIVWVGKTALSLEDVEPEEDEDEGDAEDA